MEPFEETRLVKITVLAKPYENAQIMVRVEEATQKTGFRRHSGKMKTALLVLGHWTGQTVLRRGTIVTEANYKPSVTVKLTGHRIRPRPALLRHRSGSSSFDGITIFYGLLQRNKDALPV